MPEEKKTPAQNVEYKLPPGGLPSVYSNNVAISPNIFDLRLYFGELAQATPDKIIINQQVEIVISWLEAKIFAAFLQSHLDAFEKKNGPIKFPLPPDAPENKNPFGEASSINIQQVPIPKEA